jgi:hypothetical protein
MDTSPEYIQMCEKAEEIQNRILNKGDYYTFALKKLVFHARPEEMVGDYWKPKIWYEDIPIKFGDYAIWLPRRDQLQEMVTGRCGITFHDIVKVFQAVIGWHNCHHISYNLSGMEQLWLAFVMAELYHQQWNGEEWIKKGLS